MASKRYLKKGLNDLVIDVVEECFSVQLYNDTKTEASDKLIQEAVDFQDEMLSKINKAKSKAEFKEIHTQIENKAEDLVHSLNGL